MQNDNSVKELVGILAQSNIFVTPGVKPELIGNMDVDLLASKLIGVHKSESDAVFIGADEISKMVESLKVEKAPVPIEVIRPADFKPGAAEMDAEYRVMNKPNERTQGTTSDFVNYFRSRLGKLRSLLGERRNDASGLVPRLELLKTFAGGREVMIVGIVTNRFSTKKGNVMVVMEDETAEAKVMFMNGTSAQAKGLFDQAGSVINDDVIAVKGKISGPFVIATEIFWPDVPIKEKKKVADDIAIGFLSDIHIGSKRFMEKNFSRMIQWLNGNAEGGRNRELAGKIKYLVIAGDDVDGIGIYPNQEHDLAILDIYEQYRALFNFMDMIPDYIHVFLLPGNHDAVQLSEPQPPLTRELLRDFKRDNVHLLSNPGSATLHGLDVLAYHGKSLDAMISSVPGLSYAHPEKAMIELLKRRHISPVYGNNVSSSIVPSREDNLVIETVPDILHMGHVHKNGLANYHGVEIVNSGTWQARTDFQMRQGHIPTPCIMPVYEMKSYNFTSVSFAGD